MKILNVVYSLGKGGTERAAQNFALGYAENGCDSRVLYTRVDGPRRMSIENMGIPVYGLEQLEDCFKIKAWEPDVVHLHSHGIFAEEFEKIKSIASTAQFIETNVFSQPSPWADRIDISYQLSEWCMWLFQKRSRKYYPSEVLPYPVEVSAFSRAENSLRNAFRKKYDFKDTDIILGRVGQNFDGKWSTSLIEVFEKLRVGDSRIKLLVVNPPGSIVESIAASVYENDIVHIEKIQGDENLSICYSSIDIFVLIAEQGESFGMVLAEALLCETPVVTLATPWGDNSQGEVVGNFEGGLVANKRKDLPILVEKLIKNKDLRKKMGERGRERIIERYDAKVVAKKSLVLLNDDEERSTVQIKYPVNLIDNTEGRIGFIYRWILRSENNFPLLIYITGYKSLRAFPRQVISFFYNRVTRIFRLKSML